MVKCSDTDFNSHNIYISTWLFSDAVLISLLQESEGKSGDSDTQSKNVESVNVSGAASSKEENESDNVRNCILW